MLENIKSSVLKSKNISPFLVPSEHHNFVFIQRILALLLKQFTDEHNACKAQKPNLLLLILIFLLVVLETFC